MIIRYLSDLHFEFMPDGGKAFVDSLPVDCDALVLAGDIGVAHGGPLLKGMRLILERFAGIPVLYVPGNHEYYSDRRERDWSSAEAGRRKAREKLDGVCDRLASFGNFVGGVDPWVKTIGDVRFVGATMWFGRAPVNAPYSVLNDYRVIPGFAQWQPEESARHLRFIDTHTDERTIVVTHHLPHGAAVAPKFRGDPTNAFYLHPEAWHVLESRGPMAWIHGHSHEPCRVVAGRTWLLRNPGGYAGHEVVEGFSTSASLDTSNLLWERDWSENVNESFRGEYGGGVA